MARYIISLVVVIVMGFIKTSPIHAGVTLLSPVNTDIETSDRLVTFKWKQIDDTRKYTYMLEIGPAIFGEAGMWNALVGIGSLKVTEYTRAIPESWGDEIAWWVKYTVDEEEPKKVHSSTISSFSIIKTSSPMHVVPPTVVTPKVVEKVPMAEEELPESLNWGVNTQPTVLGISDTTICKYKYLVNKKSSTVVECTVSPPGLIDLYMSKNGNMWRIYAKGNFTYRLLGQIEIYQCRRTWNPLTWFNCEEEYQKTEYVDIYPGVSVTTDNYVGDIPMQVYSNEGKSFYLISQEFTNTTGLKLHFTYNIYETKYGLSHDIPYDFDITSVKDFLNRVKPFSFPLAKVIGVTQWHGNTDFQKPHTGIDFGSTKEEVLAVSDGEVVANGWDNFNGECMSGGNYVVIKQSNGMYTAYFHLQQSFVRYGQKVLKGKIIGISGNTGSWNCQALKYHLHFETRLNRNQSSHVNPVSYISTDWSKVLTLNSTAFPGRLSGDNPHPSY